MLKQIYTIVWFPEQMCLNFYLSDFIRRVFKLKNRHRLEADDIKESIGNKTEKTFKGTSPTVIPKSKLPPRTTTPPLPRSDTFSQKEFSQETRTNTYNWKSSPFYPLSKSFQHEYWKQNPIVVYVEPSSSQSSMLSIFTLWLCKI